MLGDAESANVEGQISNLWCLDNLEWTHENNKEANKVQQRNTSCTFVELTCAIDIITGGRCGPTDASYRDKVDICKKIWNAAANQFRFKTKIRTANDLPTAAPLGYDKMQGLTRRPNFDKWPGLSRGIATLVKYAKRSEDGLMARLPRIQWMTPKWQPSVMGDIMEKVGNRRKLLQEHEIQPDMAQRTLRLKAMRDNPATTTKIDPVSYTHLTLPTIYSV